MSIGDHEDVRGRKVSVLALTAVKSGDEGEASAMFPERGSVVWDQLGNEPPP